MDLEHFSEFKKYMINALRARKAANELNRLFGDCLGGEIKIFESMLFELIDDNEKYMRGIAVKDNSEDRVFIYEDVENVFVLLETEQIERLLEGQERDLDDFCKLYYNALQAESRLGPELSALRTMCDMI